MALLYGGSGGGTFIASVVAAEVYDPVFDSTIDASSIYNVLPSFYSLMDDASLFSTVWSGSMQALSGDLLNIWQIDYAKSLKDVPVVSQRKWQEVDLYQKPSFATDPGFTEEGPPNKFSYSTNSLSIAAVLSNRGRQTKYIEALKAPVTQKASLKWSVDLTVSSCDDLGGALFGYFSSEDTQHLGINSLCVGVLGDESTKESPRPFIFHASSTENSGTAVVGAVPLVLDSSYRLSATYSAASGDIILSVTRISGVRLGPLSTGTTPLNGTELLTNQFVDPSTNFGDEGVIVGDILYAFGLEFTVQSVDGSTLTVTPFALPVYNNDVTYEIRGLVLDSVLSLNLPAECADNQFTVDQFGAASLGMRVTSTQFVPAISEARNKSISLSTEAWQYLDPSMDYQILSLPRLQSTPTSPAEILYETLDYSVSDRTILFQDAPVRTYWAEYVGYDEEYIQNNFGNNVNVTGASTDVYKSKIRGLYYAYFQGPTVEAIRTGAHILLDLPIAEEAGTVDSINPAYSGVYGQIIIGDVSYLYPLSVGTDLAVGDAVVEFQPLCRGVGVSDWKNNPNWFNSRLQEAASLSATGEIVQAYEIQKFHSFSIDLDIGILDLTLLPEVIAFTQSIKPTWKDPYFTVQQVLDDNVEVSDIFVVGLTMHVEDSASSLAATPAYDATVYDPPEVDWRYSQGGQDWEATSSAMRSNVTSMTGYVTLSASTTVTGTGTEFLAEVGTGTVANRRLAIATYRTSAAGSTIAAETSLTDATANFLQTGREVKIGDTVSIPSDPHTTFAVRRVVSSTELELDYATTATAGSVSYTVTGVMGIWVSVSSIATDTSLVVGTAFAGAAGTYKASLIKNAFFKVYYDEKDENTPDERLSFTATIDPTYAGALPLDIVLPVAQGVAVTRTFTATTGAGSVVKTTLDEPGI